jgi:P-type Ca2+ transporter type 2C
MPTTNDASGAETAVLLAGTEGAVAWTDSGGADSSPGEADFRRSPGTSASQSARRAGPRGGTLVATGRCIVAPQSIVAWHVLSGEEAASRLGSGAAGLSDAAAAERLQRVGPNRVERMKPTPALRILRNQLASIVVWLLAAAVVVSLALGDVAEAAAIGAVLVLNTGLGFTIDLRARRAMDALLRLDVARCAVVRAGSVRVIDAHALVPGDVIDVARGQSVPADARLSTTHDLRVMEAALTGESLPVAKHASACLDAGTPLAERTTMIYKGTTIAAGAARAVVTATGAQTELGRIGALVAGITEGPTPLERRLDELGRRLVWLVLVMAAASAALNLLHGAQWSLVLQMGIALAVAAVPEALPAVATIARDRPAADGGAPCARAPAGGSRGTRVGHGGVQRQDAHPHVW